MVTPSTTRTTPSTQHQPTRASISLALWPVAQISAQYQRADTYLAGCSEHPAKMLPELARRIVADYSRPGDLVADPMAGIGTTLVERNVMLLAAIRDDRIIPRASFFALEQVRRARAAGVPRLVVGHEDLLVFRSAENCVESAELNESGRTNVRTKPAGAVSNESPPALRTAP